MDFRKKNIKTQSQEDNIMCDSLNDAVRISDCIVSNDMMT
jgi:hypothetical protein